MQLLRQEDPRSPLERARKPELVRFANAHGIKDIDENMPAILIRKRLRERGLVNINIPPRPLGSFTGAQDPSAITSDTVNAASVEDALEQSFTSQAAAAPEADIATMAMNELRAECKKRGIKMARTDNLNSLRAKLNGQDAP